jgi:hypothetical protein
LPAISAIISQRLLHSHYMPCFAIDFRQMLSLRFAIAMMPAPPDITHFLLLRLPPGLSFDIAAYATLLPPFADAIVFISSLLFAIILPMRCRHTP